MHMSDELYAEYLEFWSNSCRPMTAQEAAEAFLEDQEITGVDPTDLADRHYAT